MCQVTQNDTFSIPYPKKKKQSMLIYHLSQKVHKKLSLLKKKFNYLINILSLFLKSVNRLFSFSIEIRINNRVII